VAAPLLLYSAGTWLAYAIAQQYYRGEHYVWCTRYFDRRDADAADGLIPPTSCPADIYHSLWDEVERGDLHSAKVKDNRVGIVRGAIEQHKARIIPTAQKREIIAIAEAAETSMFRPVIYVIPYPGVQKLVRRVAVSKRANPMAEELIIERLPRRLFGIIELRRR
jgi:hypothetical protein